MKAREIVQTTMAKVWGSTDMELGNEDTVSGRSIFEDIEDARKDWTYAQNYFQNVTDPALVDHAIYLLEAAEARYNYLLREARGVVKA